MRKYRHGCDDTRSKIKEYHWVCNECGSMSCGFFDKPEYHSELKPHFIAKPIDNGNWVIYLFISLLIGSIIVASAMAYYITMYIYQNVSETNLTMITMGLLIMTTVYFISPYRFCFMCWEFHKKSKD